jgi:predicted nucleotidyltransferase
VKSLILFGSHARGSGREDSDIDVAVISEDLSGNLLEDDLLVMRARRNVDLRIEPHPFRPEDFRDENPLVWEIKRRGVVII